MNNNYFKIYESIRLFRREAWDKCNLEGNIFLSYDFLYLLEKSGSVGKEKGWQPVYFGLYKNNILIACCASFIKYHSQGEYVFDHSWANAYSSLGLSYYPKLLIASPFSPVTGLRILINPESDDTSKAHLLKKIIQFCKDKKLSSLHINFFDRKELAFLKKNNFLLRYGEQFHFLNDGYSSFEDFLNSLSYKKRKSIIKERRKAKENNIKIQILEGERVNKKICKKMYQFYISTIKKKWSYNYLTEDFFLDLASSLKENIILIIASDNNRIIAGALNFLSGDTLYGRYWGSEVNVPYLHFEVCFYQAIEYAIKKRLKKVEAGAQGLHKVKRGYLPIKTYSAHMIFDKRLSSAIKNFLQEEEKVINKEIDLIKEEMSPFKK